MPDAHEAMLSELLGDYSYNSLGPLNLNFITVTALTIFCLLTTLRLKDMIPVFQEFHAITNTVFWKENAMILNRMALSLL